MNKESNLQNILVSDIEIGDRFRKDYGDIGQFIYSIKTKGLITPIAVGITEILNINGEKSDKKYTLLAGGRRMQAITDLKWTTVPAKIFDYPLSELDYRAIELAENLDRKDMSFVEEIALKRKINDLQIAIHGQKFGKSADASGWSQSDTAKLLKESPTNLSKDLKLADAIEQFPDLGLDKCKSKSDAMKLLKSVGKKLSNIEASDKFKKEIKGKAGRINRLVDSYILGDCLITMKQIPDNSINFIEIDPPYAMDLHAKKSQGSMLGYNEVSTGDYEVLMRQVFKESYRVLRPDSWLICWFAMDPWFHKISQWLSKEGFKFNLLPGLWAKPNGQTQQPETTLANTYEPFFYCRKGSPKIEKMGRSNIFAYNPLSHTKKYHPTQRPIELMDEIFTTFTRPNQTVYVPFLGSGISLIAAERALCKGFGNDLTKDFKDGFVVNVKSYYPEG